MKINRKTAFIPLLVGGICISNIVSASDFLITAQPYYLKKNYSVNSDISTNISGLYSYIGYKKHSLKLDVEKTSVTNDEFSKQNDVVAVYTNYQIPNWQLSIGGHHANVTNLIYTLDETSNNVTSSPFSYQLNALILGAQYSDYTDGLVNWLAGVNVTSANISNNSQPKFSQISPYYGHYFAVNNNKDSIYAGINLYGQFFNQDIQNKKTYIATEATLKYLTAQTSYSISAQFGDNINQFSLGGFSYLGDNLKYSSKYDVSIKHSFSPSFFAKTSFNYQNYSTAAGDNESIKVMLFSIGYVF